MKTSTLVVVVAVILAIAVGAWWFTRGKSEPQPAAPGTAATETSVGLGGQMFEQVSANPGEKMPETNPFTGKTVANPYSDSYKNPFGQ